MRVLWVWCISSHLCRALLLGSIAIYALLSIFFCSLHCCCIFKFCTYLLNCEHWANRLRVESYSTARITECDECKTKNIPSFAEKFAIKRANKICANLDRRRFLLPLLLFYRQYNLFALNHCTCVVLYVLCIMQRMILVWWGTPLNKLLFLWIERKKCVCVCVCMQCMMVSIIICYFNST